MDYRQKKAIEHIEASYSQKVFLRYLAVGIVLVIAVVFLQDNIRSLRYAPMPIIIIYIMGAVNFTVTALFLKKIIKKEHCFKTILNTDFYSTFIDNIIAVLLIPVFSDVFVSAFWFIPVFAIALLLSLHNLKHIHLIIICMCPFLSYVLHFLYHFFISGTEITFMPENFIFSAVIASLTFYVYSITTQRRYMHYLLSDDREKLDNFLLRHNVSEREKEVFHLLLTGCSTKEIANKLCISVKTADNHISSIFKKTDTHSRIELYTAFSDWYPEKY